MTEIRIGQTNDAFADKLYILTAQDRFVITDLFSRAILNTLQKTPGTYELCQSMTFSPADIERMKDINGMLGGLLFPQNDTVMGGDVPDEPELLKALLTALFRGARRDGDSYVMDCRLRLSRPALEVLAEMLIDVGGYISADTLEAK